MKRRDLERHLRAQGATEARQGARHAIWTRASRSAALPRHNEIKFTVARAICRSLEVPDPPGR